jgi:hypothetical protein
MTNAAMVDRETLAESASVRIMAFLQATQILRGLDNDEIYDRGYRLVQRMAMDSALEDASPPTKLTLEECADVLNFLHSTELIKPAQFFASRTMPSPHCGYILIMICLENNLRNAARRRKR